MSEHPIAKVEILGRIHTEDGLVEDQVLGTVLNLDPNQDLQLDFINLLRKVADFAEEDWEENHG